LGGYEGAIRKLNTADPIKGFIWRSYSPASFDLAGVERRYFTEKNAERIDSIRTHIREWSESGLINETEERLLIADLFAALNRVANIAGTFGCFLSKWTSQANETIEMRCRELKSMPTILETSVGDVFDVQYDTSDVVYLDPPYTKRQYASYYHILETVALDDTPSIEGVSGLRPWKDRASDFCYKTKALGTLTRLISILNVHRILLSYSSEGHIEIEDLIEGISRIGICTIHPLGIIGRYRPNKVASSGGTDVREYLAVIARDAQQRMGSISQAVMADAFA
jgi:adenine-specific DNA-methyltransferase